MTKRRRGTYNALVEAVEQAREGFAYVLTRRKSQGFAVTDTARAWLNRFGEDSLDIGGRSSGTADREKNDLMAIAYEQGREDEQANIGKTWLYFRCKRCGKVEAPHQIEAGDEALPIVDCGCYMGPKWEPVIVGRQHA